MNPRPDDAPLDRLVKELLTDCFDVAPEKLAPETPLSELGLDSIVMLSVILDVEERLDVEIVDLSMPADPRLQDLTALIQRNLAAKR